MASSICAALMTNARRNFSLSGPSIALDPRVNAIRPDLADVSLAALLFAPHYASPIERACIQVSTPMFDKPNGELSSEILGGERFWMLDQSGGWAWGWSGHDHYVGYVASAAIGPVEALITTPANGDPVETAQQFLGMPYVWGGRGGAGIDCSGLIQRALAALGIAAPRDSDMQLAALGRDLSAGETLARGDIVVFPGHVGLMADPDTLIHATRHHGKTVCEPLADVIARVGETHEIPVLARRRIV